MARDSYIRNLSDRVGWVWKLWGVVGASVAAGWGGHAWLGGLMTQFDTRYQTQAGATVDRDRIALLEVQRESRELTIATLEADLAQLRKDFDQYRAQNPSPAPRRAAR